MPGTLLVATWGIPHRWQRVEYELEGERLSSYTSLSMLVKKHCSGDSSCSALIIVADSAAAKSGDEEWVKRVSAYTDIVEVARSTIDDWIRDNIVGDDPLANLYSAGRVYIKVAPNIGSFPIGSVRQPRGMLSLAIDDKLTSRGLVVSPLGLYEVHALSYILDMLLDGRGEYDSVVVDLTHGVNFMPLATFRAALHAARTYAVSRGRSVNIYVYNSEPVYGNYPGPYRIHMLDSYTIEPPKAAFMLAYSTKWFHGSKGLRLTKQAGRLQSELQKRVRALGREVSRHYLDWLVAVGAYKACAGLAAIYYASSRNEDCNLCRAVSQLDEALQLARKAVEVTRDGEGVKAKWVLAAPRNSAWALTAAASIADYVVRNVAHVALNPEEEGVSVEDLQAVAENMGKGEGAGMTRCMMAVNECDSLKKNCLENPDEERCPLIVGDDVWPEEECMSSSASPRNFVAHGGLERNLVEAKRTREGRLKLRYRKGCWGIVKNLLVDLTRR